MVFFEVWVVNVLWCVSTCFPLIWIDIEVNSFDSSSFRWFFPKILWLMAVNSSIKITHGHQRCILDFGFLDSGKGTVNEKRGHIWRFPYKIEKQKRFSAHWEAPANWNNFQTLQLRTENKVIRLFLTEEISSKKKNISSKGMNIYKTISGGHCHFLSRDKPLMVI